MGKKSLVNYVCGINIFLNIIIISAALFPHLVFPYLFADYYSKHYAAINNISSFAFYATCICSIIGSIKFDKARYFIFIAVFLDFIAPIIFPTFVNQWQINFILNNCIMLNVAILSYHYLHDNN